MSRNSKLNIALISSLFLLLALVVSPAAAQQTRTDRQKTDKKTDQQKSGQTTGSQADQPQKRDQQRTTRRTGRRGPQHQQETIQKLIVDKGHEKREGDLLIGYNIDEPKGWYEMRGNNLEWVEPQQGQTNHFEIVLRDAEDKRIVPNAKVRVTITDANGNEVDSQNLTFLWHPDFYHYGANIKVPSSGNYTVKVHIDPPDFGRHDKDRGKRFTQSVDVTFTGVQITPKRPQAAMR